MNIKKQYTKEKEVGLMSPMEILEQERVAYVDEMQEYLHRLKQMNKIEAQKISFNNLVQSQIIYENGEFTEHYESSKNILSRKEVVFMYSILPNLVLGFHGCDEETYNIVLHEHNPLLPSNNSYDWLGNGIYFWEDSVDRAQQWTMV